MIKDRWQGESEFIALGHLVDKASGVEDKVYKSSNIYRGLN